MGRVTHIHDSCHTYTCTMSHRCGVCGMRRLSLRIYHTYKEVMSHLYMSRVTHMLSIRHEGPLSLSVCHTHIHESRHTHMCHVTQLPSTQRPWCVAVCCGVLRCVAVCCSVLRCVAVSCKTVRSVASYAVKTISECLATNPALFEWQWETTHIRISKMSHIWMSQGTNMNEFCLTYEYVTAHIWISHVTHMNESC